MNLRTCLYQDVPPVGEFTILNKWEKIISFQRRKNNLCCWSDRYEDADGYMIIRPHLKSWKNRRDLTRDWKNKGGRDRVDASAKNKLLKRHIERPSMYTFRLLCSIPK